VISGTVEVRISEFKPWLEKETARSLTPLNAQGEKLLDKIRERLSETRAACEKLAEEAKKEAERGKAVRKAKLTEKLTRHFLKQMDNVVFPNEVSFSGLEKFHSNLEKAFSSIARERSIWFPRISPLFILARRRIDLELTRLTGSITELRGFLSGGFARAKAIEELSTKTDDMIRSLNDVDVYQRQRTDVEEKARRLQEQIDSCTAELEAIKKSAELGDLSELTQRIQQLRKQVDHELRHLQKPFVKFMNLRETGAALPSSELQKLHQYLEDPLAALATEEPGYPKLKGILTRVGRMMDEGKLKLKGSRLRRGLQEIDEITCKDHLSNLQKECSSAFYLYQQSRSSKETEAAQSKHEHLQRRLEELSIQKEAAEARLSRLQDERRQLLERADEQRRELEKLVMENFEKRIVLKL
jgi:predicted  nucleic acid-binding Zn-ribbon protein